MSTPNTDGVGDAANRLTQDTAALVRQELQAVRKELLATARRAGAGAGLCAGAGVCGLLALCAAHSTLLRALEHTMPRGRAAATLTALYAAAAAGLGVAGRERLRAAGLASGRALEQVREDLPGAGPGAR